jgi:hypothetical protein
MRFRVVYAVLFFFACGRAVFGQQPPAVQTSSGQATEQKDGPEAPLTPEQEREKQIRQFDLLDQGDQDSQDRAKAASRAESRRDRNQTPTPGSIAAGERDATPPSNAPQLIGGDGTDAAQEYSGPAVLSRSYSVNRPLIPQQLKWKEFAGVSFIYDTGLAGPPISLTNYHFTGAQLSWGLAGRHFWRHDQIGVHYQGDYSRYSSNSFYSGANNAITMDYTHVVSRHISLTLSGTGSIFSPNYVLSTPTLGSDTTIANINLASSPNIQIFDNGVKQISSEADLTWQKTARLSFNFGGGYFAISRDSPALQGATGQQARWDTNYRLTKTTTIGAYYSFSHYTYPHGSGNSGTNTIGAIYSFAFSKSMQIRLRGGISRIETLGLETVPIDPAIAALLGVSTGIIDAYTKAWTSDISAQLIKDFRGGKTAFISYARGVSPGNGIYQTSRQESLSGGLNVTILRRYSARLDFGWDTLSAATQSLGNYQSEYGRISLSRNFRRGFGANFVAEFRHFDLANFASARNQVRITSGVTWSPVEGRLWPF